MHYIVQASGLRSFACSITAGGNIDLGLLGATFGEVMVEKRLAAKLRYLGSQSI